MKKVIITAPVHQNLIDGLKNIGYDVSFQPAITYAQLEEEVKDAEGLVITTRIQVDKNLIDKGPELKWVGRLGSGMELIDVDHAQSKGINCISTPEGNRNAVAEHCLALLLNMLNNVSKSYLEIRDGKWLRRENTGTELAGKTAGIIGFGNTGSSFAKILSPFNVKVLAYDKYRNGFSEGYITEATLDQVYEQANVISLHVPLTAETLQFANTDFFNKLQKKPYFITTCRGKVTDLSALIMALKDEKIAGAALDVLENENLSSYNQKEKEQLTFLLDHPNVILTPHIAGYSHQAFEKMASALIEKLQKLG